MFVSGSHLSYFKIKLTAKELQELCDMYLFYIAAWESAAIKPDNTGFLYFVIQTI